MLSRVSSAYAKKQSLQALGRCADENFAYSWETQTGAFTKYHIFGAVSLTVELDIYTGKRKTALLFWLCSLIFSFIFFFSSFLLFFFFFVFVVFLFLLFFYFLLFFFPL